MHIMIRMCMLVIMALIVRTAIAAERVQQAGDPGVGTHVTAGSFPLIAEWREHLSSRSSDMLPPPPPGPYMSTALTPMPGIYEPESGVEQSTGAEMADSPFFKTNMQWPEDNRQPPRRWMPEQGQYQYVPEEVLEQQKQLDTGYRRNYLPTRAWREYARPVYHSQPAYRGNSVYGNN
jgi:hypothetical protein